MELVNQIKADPWYRSLSVQDQLAVGKRILDSKLKENPDFATAPYLVQEEVKRRTLSLLPTFDNPETEAVVNKTGQDFVANTNSFNKVMQEGTQAAIASSGILGFVDQLIDPTKASAKDRVRALEYYSEMERISGRSDPASTVGSLFGNILDVAAVSVAMSPLTSAAAGAIGVAARGGKAVAATAKALGITAPVRNKVLAYLGPIAAESIIEALPYYLIEEQKRTQTGQRSVASEGAVAVAKTMGESAAVDFLLGTAMTAILGYSWKTGKAIFGDNKAMSVAKKTTEEMNEALLRIEAGTADKSILDQFDAVTRARAEQHLETAKWVRRDIADPDSNQWGKLSYLAQNSGQVLSKKADGFSIYQFDESGKAIEKTYKNIIDVEDNLSYRYYAYANKARPKDPLSAVRPELLPNYQRGMLLAQQEALFSLDNIKATNPALYTKLKVLPKAQQSSLKRPYITMGEAYSLEKANVTGLTLRTNIPLVDNIVDAANSAQVNLMKNSGPIRASISDTPNAILIGVRGAPADLYEEATKRAQKLLANEPYRNLDDARASILLNQGFDYHTHPDGSSEFFTPRNLKLIGIDDDVLIAPKNPFLKGPSSTVAIVEEGISGIIKGKTAVSNEDLVLDAALKSIRSEDADSIQNFSKFYLSSNGSSSNIKMIYNASSNPLAVRKLSDDTIEIAIGRRANSYSNEKKTIQNLIDGLNEALPKEAKKKFTGDFFVQKMKKSPAAFGLPPSVNKIAWLSQVTTDIGGKINRNGDLLNIILPSATRSFQNIDDAISFIARHTVDKHGAVQDLLNQGIRVLRSADGSWIARTLSSGKHIASAKDFDDLLNNINYMPSKLDIRYGPEVIEVTPDGLKFTMNGTSYFSNTTQALKTISRFENKSFLAQTKVIKSFSQKDLILDANNIYRVKLRDYDYIAKFNNLSEAKQFLTETAMSIDDLRKMAEKKFLSFDIQKGKFILQDHAIVHTLSSIDELKAKMLEYPDIENSVPDLIPLDPETAQALPDLINQFKAQTWINRQAGKNPGNLPPEFPPAENIKELSTWNKFTSITGEFYSWFDRIADQIKAPGLITWGNKMKLHTRLMYTDKNEVVKYLESAFRGPHNRILNAESRRKIFYHLGAEEGSEQAEAMAKLYRQSYAKDLAPLNALEEATAVQVRQLYKALGEKFGIDFYKLVTDYMPRLQVYSKTLKQETLSAKIHLTELAKDMPDWANGNLPKELKFWAENERTSDLPRFFLKDDAFEVTLMYATQGLKKYHLNNSWQEIDRYVSELRKTGQNIEDWHVRLYQFKEAIMGSHQSPGEKFVSDFGASMFRGIKRSPIGKMLPFSEREMESFGRDILGNMLALNYFTSLAWKPFLAVRNSFQTLTTLAPRFGTDATLRSWKEILQNPEVFYDAYRKKGILADKAPIVNSFFGGESRIGAITREGYRWFKNSDDLTRAVAYHTGELRIQDALNYKALNPNISEKEFISFAALDRINPISTEEIMTLIRNNSIEAAKDKFGDIIQRSTMFDYAGATTPQLHQSGILGKLFGQYGTYAASYRANLAETFRYATAAQRIESMAVYLALNGILWAGFDALRIRTNDFIPFTPGIFTGGPAFDIAINMVKATNLNFEGEQARAALRRDLPTFIPGSAQFKSVSNFLERMDSGDIYGATLSLMAAPVLD